MKYIYLLVAAALLLSCDNNGSGNNSQSGDVEIVDDDNPDVVEWAPAEEYDDYEEYEDYEDYEEYEEVRPATRSSPSNAQPVYQYQPQTRWENCQWCNGTGQCQFCHGGGLDAHSFSQTGDTYIYNCGGCNGSGVCQQCRGRRGQYVTY